MYNTSQLLAYSKSIETKTENRQHFPINVHEGVRIVYLYNTTQYYGVELRLYYKHAMIYSRLGFLHSCPRIRQ